MKCSISWCERPIVRKEKQVCLTHYGQLRRGKILRESNEVVDKEGYCEIKLLGWKDVITGTALVSTADKAKVAGYRWARSGNGYVRSFNGRSYVYMHQLLMPKRKGYLPDHRNGNKLDNRRENLRYITPSENGLNSIKPKKGIYFSKIHNLWMAQIYVKGKHFAKYAKTEEAALKLRRELEEIHCPGIVLR